MSLKYSTRKYGNDEINGDKLAGDVSPFQPQEKERDEQGRPKSNGEGVFVLVCLAAIVILIHLPNTWGII